MLSTGSMVLPAGNYNQNPLAITLIYAFDDGQPLYDLIKQRNQQYGLARMVATADFPYVVNHGTWYVTAGQLKLPWDKVNLTDDPWALRPETLNEVGSIYTIQGFDLNYTGSFLALLWAMMKTMIGLSFALNAMKIKKRSKTGQT